MASIIFLSPDFTFTKELYERFKSAGRPKQIEDRLTGLLKKETELIEKEFRSSIKSKRGVDSKKSVKVITSLENFYKNADSIIKNSKIIIVSDLETRKLFRKKSAPGGVNRDTFINRLIKVGERNSITIKSYLLLYEYDIDKVFDKNSFTDLVSNTREQYIKSSEFGAGFITQVDRGDKSSFIDYELGDALASAPAGVSEFRGVADVLKKEEEADEETTINEAIQIQKKAKANAKIIFTPTGNMVKDLKIAIVNKLLIKIKYASDNKSEELATGVRVIEPVALGQSKKSPAKGLAIRAWLKKGDTNNPEDRPGWRFLYVSNIKSIEFTGDVFNYKRPSYNSAGDKWMSSISAIASFDTKRIYGKGRRAEIHTSMVETLSILISTSSGHELRSYVKKLKEIKRNHESGKQVLGYADRELLYSYFP